MHENRSGRMRLGSSCTNWAVGAHLKKGLLDQWPLATSAVSRQEIGGRDTAIPTVQLPWFEKAHVHTTPARRARIWEDASALRSRAQVKAGVTCSAANLTWLFDASKFQVHGTVQW